MMNGQKNIKFRCPVYCPFIFVFVYYAVLLLITSLVIRDVNKRELK